MPDRGARGNARRRVGMLHNFRADPFRRNPRYEGSDDSPPDAPRFRRASAPRRELKSRSHYSPRKTQPAVFSSTPYSAPPKIHLRSWTLRHQKRKPLHRAGDAQLRRAALSWPARVLSENARKKAQPPPRQPLAAIAFPSVLTSKQS